MCRYYYVDTICVDTICLDTICADTICVATIYYGEHFNVSPKFCMCCTKVVFELDFSYGTDRGREKSKRVVTYWSALATCHLTVASPFWNISGILLLVTFKQQQLLRFSQDQTTGETLALSYNRLTHVGFLNSAPFNHIFESQEGQAYSIISSY